MVDEVSGYTPTARYAYLRQRVGGEITASTLAQFPNTDSAWLFLSDTPGTASVEIAMVIGTLPPLLAITPVEQRSLAGSDL